MSRLTEFSPEFLEVGDSKYNKLRRKRLLFWVVEFPAPKRGIYSDEPGAWSGYRQRERGGCPQHQNEFLELGDIIQGEVRKK